jgi:uncharacterized protein (TIGR02231 family)
MNELNSQTIAVTVFTDRARVTRRATTPLAPGLHTLAFGNLPLALLPDSVRASGRGTARARLLGVNARREHFAETPAEAARDLERQIEDLEAQDAGLAARLGVLDNEEANLAALGGQAEMYARGLALRSRPAEEVIGLLGALTARVQQLETQKLDLNRERRSLGRELDRLRRELKAMQGARPRERWSAEVELECREAGDLDIELTYVVTGAGWHPLYDLRLSDAGLELTYLGQVFQQTGEDWAGASLTLSTALPALSLVIPELDPWFVEPLLPRPAAPKRAMAATAMRAPVSPMQAAPAPALTAAPETMPVREFIETEASQAEVAVSGAAVTYRVGGSVDVPGDGTPRKTTIAVFRLSPALDYVTAPKLADAAYRRAKVTNESPYVLLPGPAQLFEADEYLGATALELTSPGQEFELVLGADERVRVKRELKARDVDKRLVADRRRVRYAYEIEVENLLDAEQTVYVRDHIPVSRHEDIKVKLEFLDPKVIEQSELNLLEWKLTVGKGQKRTIRYEYAVEAPRAMQVRGLE